MLSPQSLFECLFVAYGPQHWWPAKSVTEMMVGAVLVQNTTWIQVTKVIARLESDGYLSMESLRQIPEEMLWELLRPAGYFRIKTRRIKALAEFMSGFDDLPAILFQLPTNVLRQTLLQVHGIGKETADSIICYGAKRPVFVVDAYSKRLFQRLGWLGLKSSYDEVQTLVQNEFVSDALQLGEFHALIVQHAKEHCRTRPVCDTCPVLFCPAQGSQST